MRFLVFIFLLTSNIALATTYYYSSVSGNDANAGTSSGAPWRSFTNFSSKTFNAGDSILLKAGETFDGPIRSSRPGSNGNPITFSRYGTGADPIVYGDHPTAVWSAVGGHAGVFSTYTGIAGISNPDLVYDSAGLKYTLIARGTNTLDNWLNTFTNTSWGYDSTVNVYVKTADSNAPSAFHVFEFANIWFTAGYWVMSNIESCNGNKGLYIQGAGNKVMTNYFHDTYSSGVYAGNAWSTEIASNSILNDGYTKIYLVGGGSNWVHDNMLISNSLVIMGNISLPAGDTSGIGLLTGTNNIIEFNTIKYVREAFVDYYYEVNSDVRYNYGFHAATASSPNGTGLKEHHNVWDLDYAGVGIATANYYDAGISPLPDSGPNVIYNNLIYKFIHYGLYSSGVSASNTIVRNNIFLMDSISAGGAHLDIFPGTDTDYNLFYSTTNASTQRWKISDNGVVYTNLAAYTAATGQEAHSVYAMPIFNADSPTNALDFRLQAGSPGINVGQNVKTAGWIPSDYTYVDYLGVPIPAGSGADIGAFEGVMKILTVGNFNQRAAASGVNTSGLVAWWSMDEASGTRANTWNPGTHDAVESGSVTLGTGKVAGDAVFNGGTDSLEVPDNAALSTTGDFTVMTWAYFDSVTGAQFLVTKGTTTSDNDQEYCFQTSGTTFYFVVGNGAASGYVQSSLTMATGGWYFIAGRYDATADKLDLRINTTSETQVTYTGGSFNGTAQLAFSGNDLLRAFAGSLDEISYWTRRLSDSELDYWYNSGSGRAHP